MDAQERFMANQGLVRAYISRRYPYYIQDEDMLQAAWIGLWLACLKADRCRGAFSTYACACIENEIRAEFRRRRQGDRAQAGEAAGEDPAEVAVSRTSAAELISKLAGGDARMRAVLIRRMEGLTLREVADTCGLSRHQVSRRLRTARERLTKGAR